MRGGRSTQSDLAGRSADTMAARAPVPELPDPADLRHIPPGVARTAMIEGVFTHDALPDLFRYLCGRKESLWWELTTLAGRFALVFEHGEPIDVMFSPARPVGGKVGLRALQILFRQEGGRFVVHGGLSRQERRTLHLSGEQLLIELATLDDESVAPAVMSGATVDLSAELELVVDVAPLDHRTAFRTQSQDVPMTDVLQLFSVSRLAYWINLLGVQGERAGRLLLSANEVQGAEYGPLRGRRAFTALVAHDVPGIIDVSPSNGDSEGLVGIGRLDALLMREVLSGRMGEPRQVTRAAPASLSAVHPSAGPLPCTTPAGLPPVQTGPNPAGRAPAAPLLARVLGFLPRGRSRDR